MPFHPEVLSEATLKDLARNMQLGSKTVLPQQPLKLSKAQELLARTLGHNSWHAAITQAKTNLNKTGQQRLAELSDAVDRASDPKNLSALIAAVKAEAGLLSLENTESPRKPNEKTHDARSIASIKFAQALEERIQHCPPFWVDDCELNHEEVCAIDGLLAVLLFKAFPNGVKGFTLRRCDASLSGWLVLFTGSTTQRNRVLSKLEQTLKAVPHDSIQKQSPNIDAWYQDFKINSKRTVGWIVRQVEGGSARLIGKPL